MHADVKICGLTRPQDVEMAIMSGVSYLGFIVEAESKRRVSVTEAARLVRPVKGIVSTVAVTVNANDDMLRRIMHEMAPDYIQCHGDENLIRVAQISADYKVKTIKAMAIETDTDMKLAETYSGAADFILYDAKPPKGSNIRGGHGIAVDWDIIGRAPKSKYWGLAGGLTPDNVAGAIAATDALMVDVSSGVESAAGVKSASKIKAFMEAVRHG